MSDRSTSGPMPPELEPLHQRLLADSAAWSTLVPSTERLRAHTKHLTSGRGDAAAGVAGVTGVTARSPKIYAFEEEEMDDTEAETTLVRTSIRPSTAAHPNRMRGLVATVAAAVVVLLLAGTLYALGARPGGIGGQGTATPLPTPAPATGVGVPGPQGRFVPSAVAALGVDATGASVQQGGTFDISHLIYVVARVQGVGPGETHTLTIRWYVNGQLADFPNTPYSQTVTSDGYIYFRIKLAPGAAIAKLYWDLPAADTAGVEASLAQTVAFTVVPAPTVAPGAGATPTPAPSSPYTPVSTPSESGAPTPGGSVISTPTPQPAVP